MPVMRIQSRAVRRFGEFVVIVLEGIGLHIGLQVSKLRAGTPLRITVRRTLRRP
jgi:hypothetical protein